MPEADEQLIPFALVNAARAREVTAGAWEERILGVDVVRFGDGRLAIYFRHGRDGNPIPYQCLSGLDTMQVAARVAEWIGHWSSHAIFLTTAVSAEACRPAPSVGVLEGHRRQLRCEVGPRPGRVEGGEQADRDVAVAAGLARRRIASE